MHKGTLQPLSMHIAMGTFLPPEHWPASQLSFPLRGSLRGGPLVECFIEYTCRPVSNGEV